MEANIGEAIGDKNFALPYWDWTDCYKDGDTKTCGPLFDKGYLGSSEVFDYKALGYEYDSLPAKQ